MKRLIVGLMLLVGTVCTGQVNLNNGLVAYYPFNGDANDASGNGNNASFNNATLTSGQNGTSNTAYYFNGTDSYITIPNSSSLNLGNQITLYALVKVDGFYKGRCHWNRIINKGDADYSSGNYWLGFTDEAFLDNYACDVPNVDVAHQNFHGSAYLGGWGDGNYNPDPIETGRWYSVVFTHDGNYNKIYVNCKLIYSFYAPIGTLNNSHDLFIGRLNDINYPYWFNGAIDEIRIYNRAINLDEVKALGNCPEVRASFTAPDTVCVNTPVNITNTATLATTYNWNFCVADVNNTPSGVNLGNPSGNFARPVFIDYAFDNGVYYGFMVNNSPGGLVKLDFGNSLLNTPTSTYLGNFGGDISNSSQGIQLVRNGGRWIAIIVGGDPLDGTASRVLKADFGTSLNNTPIVTNWGNIGNLNYPTDLYVFKAGNDWHGLTVNYNSGTITRFDFGTDFSSIPTGINIGSPGNLNKPSGICPINDNGTWRIFVTNFGNHTLSRIDFGNSLLNTPTSSINLGNIGNAFSQPRDLYIFNYCSRTVGFLINGGNNNVVRLDFDNLIIPPTSAVLGNIGNLNTPHSISKLTRVGSDLVGFIQNAYYNTFSRIVFSGACASTNIPSSNQFSPPVITYSQSGTYNINLTVDEGLPTQTSFCKEIVVVGKPEIPTLSDFSICPGETVNLDATATHATKYTWTPATDLSADNISNPTSTPANTTTYTVVAANAGCSSTEDIKITVKTQAECTPPVASFTIPASVCVNTPVQITNTSTNAKTYHWNYCVGNINTTPNAINLGNIGNQFSSPVFMDFAKHNGNYYGFVTNHSHGRLTRLDFGNSLLNTPTAVDLGNIGVIPNFVEGIQLVNNRNKWYAIIVGGNNTVQGGPTGMVKIDFGSDLANPLPTGTSWGAIGGLNYPGDLHLFKDADNWYALTFNIDNSITRISFGNSFDNTPVASNLGIFSDFNNPTGIFAMTDNGEWHVFVINRNNSTITRLDFGTSLLNAPTSVNLGNPGNALNVPRDVYITKFCEQITGFVVNEGSSDIVKMNFTDLKSAPTAVSLGNIGSFSFPHSISKIFREGSDVYCFITNVNNNSLSRLQFAGCTNSTILNSINATPPPITYTTPGIYNINLTIDEDLPTQASFCTKITVHPAPTADFNYTLDLCNPKSISFTNASTDYQTLHWNFGNNTTDDNNETPSITYDDYNNYTVTLKAINQYTCEKEISKIIPVTLSKARLIITRDPLVCKVDNVNLNSVSALKYCWSPGAGLSDPAIANPVFTPVGAGSFMYYLNAMTVGDNLITNGNFSQGNTGFTSDYLYNATSGVNAGVYAVRPDIQGWHSGMRGCSGRTGNNDNMMMVNGTATLDARVWSQTITVKPNTDYAFSAWLQDITYLNPAQLQFSINGIQLGQIFTANPQGCIWEQFYTIWNSGSATTATISIINKNTVFAGNDFALDDLSFAPVFIKRDSVTITVENPTLKTNNDTLVCAKEPVPLKTENLGTNIVSYTWIPSKDLDNPSSANPVAHPTASIRYTVIGTTQNGCTASDEMEVQVPESPIIAKTSDTMICRNTPAPLYVRGGSTYQWLHNSTLSDHNISNPIATPSAATMYYVTVGDNYNCMYQDSIKVSIRPYPYFTASPDSVVCEGVSLPLYATGGNIYQWTPGGSLSDPSSPNPIASPSQTTTYTVNIRETVCNYSKQFNMTLAVKPSPTVVARKSNDIDCSLPMAYLSVTGAEKYVWTPALGLSNPLIANPVSKAQVTTQYKVEGITANGCSNVDYVTVKVTDWGKLLFNIPNAFTPNGDGQNDCFGIGRYASLIDKAELSIFNRWGEKVFYTNDPNGCWDGKYKGKLQSPGAYIYMIKAKTSCGAFNTKGTVMLVQ